MDGVAQDWTYATEEGAAVATLCGGASIYTAVSFVAHYADWTPHYLTFETPTGAAAFPRWRDALFGFLRKVLYADRRGAPPGTPPRRLVLKSPDHTARVRLLLRLFPNARFVFIHRHPLEVSRSWAALVAKLCPQTAMEPFTAADGAAFGLDLCGRLANAYLADRHLIPAGRLVEVAYDKLATDPAGALATIYAGLGLTGGGGAQAAAVAQAVAYTAEGRRGRHAALSTDAVAAVAAAWRQQFDAFGYTTDHPLAGSSGGGGCGGGSERGATGVSPAAAA
eukprot:TRINITY_DN8222_c0_g1_i1.p1 TRINITY_DN8222_c0_g1~~TRINITY_DN8222_c0_g1_i1.p1  ORF type:complete len:280 (-),score=93.01 TRINITY_DN8222_c0_g1_i1:219-1058(-)